MLAYACYTAEEKQLSKKHLEERLGKRCGQQTADANDER